MRTLLLSLAGTALLVVSTQAQTPVAAEPAGQARTAARIEGESQKLPTPPPPTKGQVRYRLPAVDVDDFFPGTYRVGALRSEAEQRVSVGQWTVLEESKDHLSYQREKSTSDYSLIETIHYKEGKARAITIRVSVPPEKEGETPMFFRALGGMVAQRAEAITTRGNTSTMTHTTSDGRTMRVVWKQISATQAEIESSIGSADESMQPLK